jgi:hypothetical protein
LIRQSVEWETTAAQRGAGQTFGSIWGCKGRVGKMRAQDICKAKKISPIRTIAMHKDNQAFCLPRKCRLAAES